MRYGAYKGGKKKNNGGKVIIGLAVAAVLLIFGYFLLQDFIVFSPDGVRLDFSLFTGLFDNPITPSPTPEGDVQIVIETPGATPSPTPPPPTPPPTRAPVRVTPDTMKAIYAPPAALTQPEILSELVDVAVQAQLTALMIDIKLSDGHLTYRSNNPEASEASAEDSTMFSIAIDAIKAAGLDVVGIVSCYRDDVAARAIPDAAVKKSSGSAWTDESGSQWLNPYSFKTVNYLVDIAVEAAAFGIDEILLDNMAFPTGSDISYGNNVDMARAQTIDSLISAVSDVLDGTGARLAVAIDYASVKDDTSLDSGIAPASLAERVDRIWVKTPSKPGELEGVSEFIASLGSGVNDARVVPLITYLTDYKGPQTAVAMFGRITAVTKNLTPQSGFAMINPNGLYNWRAFSEETLPSLSPTPTPGTDQSPAP